MKKYLIILLFIGCNQKPQEQPMGLSIDPTINTRIMALANAVIKQSSKDSLQDKQILSLQALHKKDSLKIAALYDSINQVDTIAIFNKDQFQVIGNTVNLK